MTNPHTIAGVLEKAADLIEPEGAWTRGGTRVASGYTTWSEDPLAVSFCALSAISRSAGGWTTELAFACRVALRRTIGLKPHEMLGDDWNDAPERTQAEVVAKFREAAAAARKASQ